MPKSRKTSHGHEDDLVLRECLKVPGCTEKALHGILQIARPEVIPKSYSGYKRKVHKELPHDCTVKLPVGENKDGQMIHVAVTHIPKFLQHLASQNGAFARRLVHIIDRSNGESFKPLLYWDEVISGNPLAPHSSKKIAIGYFTMVELQQRHKEESWIPLLVAQHKSLETVSGGFSRMMREVVLLVRSFDMQHGIPLELDGNQRLLRIDIMKANFIADFDAIRATYNWRGSASIKACIACKNVCKRDSNLVDGENYLTEISETKWSKFDLWSDQEVFELWDMMARDTPTMKKKDKEKFEKLAGFNWNPNALFAHAEAREILKPSAVLFDPMHIFWASGVAAWEVVNLMSVLATKCNFTCEDLAGKIQGTPWCSSTRKGQSWRKNLADAQKFSGDAYRGSASDLRMLIPLMLYHIMESIDDTEPVQAELQSFYALVKLLETLASFQCGISKVKCQQLLKQTETYLELYLLAYENCKPKHHYQLHLCDMIWRTQLCVDCFPQEAKHRTYKYQLQNRLDGMLHDPFLFSEGVLTRLLNSHCRLFDKPCLPGDLTPPVSESQKLVDGSMVSVLEGAALDLEAGRVYKDDFVISPRGSGLVRACLRFRDRAWVHIDLYDRVFWTVD